MSDSFIIFLLWESIIVMIFYAAVTERRLNERIHDLEEKIKK